MIRSIDRYVLLAICGLLVIAVAKIVINKQEIAQLPRPVLETLEASFPNAYWSRVEKRSEAGRTVYDLFVRQYGEAYVVTVSPNGTLLGVSNQADRLVKLEWPQ